MKRYLLAGKYSLVIMLVCLLIFVLDRLLGLHLSRYGIAPRSTAHLSGIVISPFVHADWGHLVSNFIPFVVLGWLLGLQGVRRFCLLFLFFIISSGLLVWLFARANTIHIGMSGVIYALWGYLLVHGFVRRLLLPLFISLFTLFFYGSLIIGVFPTTVSISFESHLLGALVGAITGYTLAKR